ncbi:MAG: hypothetical protein CVT59_06600 [Actinobacteria bacterium HGW-Actinobacteria-1]|nr:MAG: hypothetical protein CVT59_06600 [Actinobacteria bacterium HGW-Actinobacteria-1]
MLISTSCRSTRIMSVTVWRTVTSVFVPGSYPASRMNDSSRTPNSTPAGLEYSAASVNARCAVKPEELCFTFQPAFFSSETCASSSATPRRSTDCSNPLPASKV